MKVNDIKLKKHLPKKNSNVYPFLELFQNAKFVKLNHKTKKPSHKLETTYNIFDIFDFSDVALLLPKNIVVIDFDLPTLKDKKIVKNLIDRGVFNDYIILQTKRGYHIYCQSETQFNNNSKKINFLGVEFDIKSFGFHANGTPKKSFVKIKNNFEFREIINLPKINNLKQLGWIQNWMTPTPNKFFDNLSFQIGERNNNLFKFSQRLLQLNWEHEDIIVVMELINNYIFEQPLEQNELKNIYNLERRSEFIQNPSINFYDEKGSLDKLAVAKFLIKKFHAVKIEIAKNDNSKNFYFYNDDDYYSVMKIGRVKAEILNLLQGKIATERQLKDIVALLTDLDTIFYNNEKVDFVKRSHTFNFKNGILFLDENRRKKMKFVEHNKNIFTTHKFNFNYNPKIIKTVSSETKKLIEQWLFKDICDNNLIKFKTLLKIICATFCFDWKGQKAFILLGDGGNGKSTFLNFLREIHGVENVSNLDIVKFGQRFGLSSIIDKTINICNDLENSNIPKASVFKMCITKEIINIEEKNKDAFDYRPTCNFIFASNELPRFSDKTDAIGERLVFFKFNNKFRDTKNQDIHFFQKINKQEVFDYVANLALIFLDEVLFDEWKDFKECENLQIEFRKLNDRIYQWFMRLNELQKTEITDIVLNNKKIDLTYYHNLFLEHEEKLNHSTINYEAFLNRIIRAVKYTKSKED